MSPDDATAPAPQSTSMVLVLVVDDEVPIALALGEIIEEAGYPVVLAYDGQQALDLVDQLQPRLVFTDLMMPRLDGRALLARLQVKSYPPGLARPAIVLMTAAGRASTRDLRADAVLLKPFELEEVETLLQQFLPPPGPARDA